MSKILFELGFEEMPVSELIMLNRFFPRQLSTYLENKNIECDKKFYSTPRRVAFIFDNVPLFTEHITAEFKGPPVHVFFDKNGEISKQGKGFLKSKNIPEKDIESKKRQHKIVFPRHLAMYLSRKLTSNSLNDIGREIGNREHAAVIYAEKIISKKICYNSLILNLIQNRLLH